MEIGLHLRQAMLVNGMLYNSEVWHSISEEEIRMLESVDEYLLRAIVKGHSKTSLEFLYLETGALPIRFIISSRRIMYLQTLLKRQAKELTRKVYTAQKDNPVKGDFCELVKNDLELIGGTIDETQLENKDKYSIKNEIKHKIRAAALVYLKDKQKDHSKIRNIEYHQLQTQGYMLSVLFSNEEVNMLHALRSRSTNVKANFKNKYSHNLKCPLCLKFEDTQSHVLECEELIKRIKTTEVSMKNFSYEDIFADCNKQKLVTHKFLEMFKIRNQLVDNNLSDIDPSTSSGVLKISDSLLNCIVHYSFGK